MVSARGERTAEVHMASARARSIPASLARVGLCFTVLAWGSSFVAARVLLSPTRAGLVTLSPTILAAMRFSLASLFFVAPLGLAIARRRVSWGDALRMALLGQLTYSTYFWLQYTGVQRTSAGVSSILVVGLAPIATALLAQALGQERLSRTSVVALGLCVAGVALIVLRQGIRLEQNTRFLVGALCLIENAVAFAVYSNFSKRWMRTVSPLVMTGGTLLSGALGLLALSFFMDGSSGWSRVSRLSSPQWGALLFLVFCCSVAAYFVYNAALTTMDASRAAAFIYFEPVVAVILGALLLGERLSPQAIAGAVLIAVSVALLQRR